MLRFSTRKQSYKTLQNVTNPNARKRYKYVMFREPKMLQNVTDFDFSSEIPHSKCCKNVTNMLQNVTILLQTSFSNVTKRYKTLQNVTNSNASMFCVILCDFCLSSFLFDFCLSMFVSFCNVLSISIRAAGSSARRGNPECKHCLGPDRMQTLFVTFEDVLELSRDVARSRDVGVILSCVLIVCGNPECKHCLGPS